MGAFWTDAESLFETARRAGGADDCDWAILVGPQGKIHLLEATGWTLPSLQAHHGADAVYRVTRQGDCVSLEGRRGSESCLLRSESPAAVARQLLGPQYSSASPNLPALLSAPAPRTQELWKMWA